MPLFATRHIRLRTLAALSLFLATASANAALVDDVNDIRIKGCRSRATLAPLTSSRDLDAVAKEWAKGGRLSDALERTGYRALSSASMRIEGAPNQRAMLAALAKNYCDTLTNPEFTTIGVSQKFADVHIVIALPFKAPTTRDAGAIAAEVLRLVNVARGQPRRCGSKSFAAVPPLTASAMLDRTALIHAQDMAAKNFFEHQGSDGRTVAARATRVGYNWRSIGENIAAGPTTAEIVVNGWLNSPGHCANIMGQTFTEMGIAFATSSKSDAGIYWAQVLGSPRI
ncbi:uncharacterized protein YkwD [Povalibacter uvarum]|uniref:Uncharacterized protein YkwD n=1 Tax=Povalibacter uvarum TaxID=732238 RepID=A0A841HJA7_9GAMM|nr:CAP domain-containing protein [Povalibacter uvarum]MBB6092674.1 uncharacterized protein YkwD [Povalibacter uvarum]